MGPRNCAGCINPTTQSAQANRASAIPGSDVGPVYEKRHLHNQETRMPDSPNHQHRSIEGIAELASDAIAESIWASRSVSEEPNYNLRRWRILQINGNRHFIGWNSTLDCGQVSSPVKMFDRELRRGVTRSGRVYQLDGLPGDDPDGDYVLGRWLDQQGLTRADAIDATATVFEETIQ